mmetsp:Transcript_19293/g.39688  ORF Transcript_19293/g.39688 Transcript_19293/m.39688 type:complete len:91 (+) Transcript_19293:147-419(+)
MSISYGTLNSALACPSPSQEPGALSRALHKRRMVELRNRGLHTPAMVVVMDSSCVVHLFCCMEKEASKWLKKWLLFQRKRRIRIFQVGSK